MMRSAGRVFSPCRAVARWALVAVVAALQAAGAAGFRAAVGPALRARAAVRCRAAAPGAGEPPRTAQQGFCEAGPRTPKPVYSDESLFDRTAIRVFRGALAQTLGGDTSAKAGYGGIMDLALELNRRYSAAETRMRTRGVLRGLFPEFIIKLFPLMFAQPFPAFSAKLNALITSLTCVWLMGPMTLFDVEADELTSPAWGDGKGQVLARACPHALPVPPSRERWCDGFRVPTWVCARVHRAC